jgi:fructose-1,6-bisphosphatase/inositol monophosphatase family enzyme
MPAPSKIFGIGLSKTGTSSLAQALQRLGFRTRDCMGAERYLPGDLASIDMETVLAHDALTDTPIPSFYRELDARFPGAKFVLTVRDRDGWLKSCRKQFNERSAAAQSEAHRRLFEDLYGTNIFDEQSFAAGYERFVAGVREYFRQRPGDLLELNVSAGEGWEKLCPFLDRPVPDAPFPKANVTSIRWMAIEDLVAAAEAAGRELLKHYAGSVAPAAASLRPPAAATVLDRALRAALRRDPAEAAAQAAQRILVTALRRLAPAIEVISPLAPAPAFEQRRHWNHVWLVDPLDGRDAFSGGHDGFTVNIALVEDGQPIYGVVHAPARGQTFYARRGKGAFVRQAGEAAVRVTAPAEAAPACAHDRRAIPGEGPSRALAMCASLEAPGPWEFEIASVAECQAAAAEAVLTAAGFAVADATGAEPAYNSRALMIGPLTIGVGETV